MKLTFDDVVAGLNGLVGDHLAKTQNGLLIPMALAGPRPTGPRVALFVHGLMATETCWSRFGFSYPENLERDLGLSPLFVRYSSGRHISENGRALHVLLEALVRDREAPLEELILIGHSMGGLVLRSATHYATEDPVRPAAWLSKVSRVIYLGTPHLGAPLERMGKALTAGLRIVGGALSDPTAEVLAEVLALRSGGIQDLGHGRLRDEDWRDDRGREPHGRDPHGAHVDPKEWLQNREHPVPLLRGLRHHLIAGKLPEGRVFGAFFGDGLVPVESALGGAPAENPAEGLGGDRSPIILREHLAIFPGVGHTGLLFNEAVYATIRGWCT